MLILIRKLVDDIYFYCNQFLDMLPKDIRLVNRLCYISSSFLPQARNSGRTLSFMGNQYL